MVEGKKISKNAQKTISEVEALLGKADKVEASEGTLKELGRLVDQMPSKKKKDNVDGLLAKIFESAAAKITDKDQVNALH